MPDPTRRDWMVTIGEAAAGFAIVREAQGDPNDQFSLPPGVYDPSRDHLSHALMSAEQYHPIPLGCPTDYVRPPGKPFEPLFFTASDFPVVHRLIQLLLGDLSGEASTSRELAEWIDLRISGAKGVREAYSKIDPLYHALAVAYLGSAQADRFATANPGKICRDGLQWIANAAHSGHSDQFLMLNAEQQIALLDSISDDRPRKAENAGTLFFEYLKAEVIRGFYTSRVGLEELDFKGNAFYARSPGCDPR